MRILYCVFGFRPRSPPRHPAVEAFPSGCMPVRILLWPRTTAGKTTTRCQIWQRLEHMPPRAPATCPQNARVTVFLRTEINAQTRFLGKSFDCERPTTHSIVAKKALSRLSRAANVRTPPFILNLKAVSWRKLISANSEARRVTRGIN